MLEREIWELVVQDSNVLDSSVFKVGMRNSQTIGDECGWGRGELMLDWGGLEEGEHSCLK